MAWVSRPDNKIKTLGSPIFGSFKNVKLRMLEINFIRGWHSKQVWCTGRHSNIICGQSNRLKKPVKINEIDTGV